MEENSNGFVVVVAGYCGKVGGNDSILLFHISLVCVQWSSYMFVYKNKHHMFHFTDKL